MSPTTSSSPVTFKIVVAESQKKNNIANMSSLALKTLKVDQVAVSSSSSSSTSSTSSIIQHIKDSLTFTKSLVDKEIEDYLDKKQSETTSSDSETDSERTVLNDDDDDDDNKTQNDDTCSEDEAVQQETTKKRSKSHKTKHSTEFVISLLMRPNAYLPPIQVIEKRFSAPIIKMQDEEKQDESSLLIGSTVIDDGW